MRTCEVQWIMRIEEMKASGLTAPLKDAPPGTPDFVGHLAPGWVSTRHEEPAEATHEVRAHHGGGRYSEWLPCCAKHAEHSRKYLANWEERLLPTEVVATQDTTAVLSIEVPS